MAITVSLYLHFREFEIQQRHGTDEDEDHRGDGRGQAKSCPESWKAMR